MHFAFSDQQNEFRDVVRQVLAKECTTDHLRAAYEAPHARSARWETLTGLGVTGCRSPTPTGVWASGWSTSYCCSRRRGRWRCPSR